MKVSAEKVAQLARLASFHIQVTAPGLDERHQPGIFRAVKACLIHNTLLGRPSIEVAVSAGGNTQYRSTKGPLQSDRALERNDEVELARQLIAGEPEAFDRFVEHFRAKIFHYSWLMCGHREDADEVAQETLLKVFENFDRLHEPERVRPWVFRIAKNACLMKRRKSVFAPSEELSLDDFLPHMNNEGGHVKLQIADWSGLPDDLLLQSEMKQVIDSAFSTLPEKYRSVILLRDMEELSTLETAQILELTEDVVKTRLHRARLAVRQKLDEYLRTDSQVPASPSRGK